MNNRFNMLTGSVLIVFLSGMIGCGEGFRSNSAKSTGAGAQSVDISSEMAKAEQANSQAIAAMVEADLALKEITDDNGNINVGLFDKSKVGFQAQGLLSGLTDKIKAVFTRVFDKVALVKQKFAVARQALMDALAKLDQNNPAQATLVAELMKKIAAVDAMEQKFRDTMHMLASKLDLAIAGLDKIISGVTTSIPGVGSIIGMALDYVLMGDVKDLINELKAKLLAL